MRRREREKKNKVCSSPQSLLSSLLHFARSLSLCTHYKQSLSSSRRQIPTSSLRTQTLSHSRCRCVKEEQARRRRLRSRFLVSASASSPIDLRRLSLFRHRLSSPSTALSFCKQIASGAASLSSLRARVASKEIKVLVKQKQDEPFPFQRRLPIETSIAFFFFLSLSHFPSLFPLIPIKK